MATASTFKLCARQELEYPQVRTVGSCCNATNCDNPLPGGFACVCQTPTKVSLAFSTLYSVSADSGGYIKMPMWAMYNTSTNMTHFSTSAQLSKALWFGSTFAISGKSTFADKLYMFNATLV